ncbi:acyltransferase family protein [Dietzia sp.]|uniref:acyltransferase family protein n=1 Tax=Dietzia sp. TaxID=1871616 RepID=UPI002FDAB8C2
MVDRGVGAASGDAGIAPQRAENAAPEHLSTRAEKKRAAEKAHGPRNNALDGIRAVAVLSVFAFHLFPASVKGGFLGVDIFFVLSGFLITSLLLREWTLGGTISLKDFWVRRARRILPAAFTVMAVSCAAVLLVSADLRVGLWHQVLGILTFTTNWVQIATGSSYFESQIPQLFLHYWSLAIEEQFYVVWPLVMLGVLWLLRGPSRHRRALVGIIALLAAGSAALMWTGFAEGEDPSAIYYGTHTHAFGLLIGGALAAVMASANRSPLARRWEGRRFPWHSETAWSVASVGASALILVAFFAMGDQSALAYRGGILVISLATAVVIAAAALGRGVLAGPLSAPAAVWIGRRSYSMYLWHWPVFVIVKYLIDDPKQAQSGVVAVASIALVLVLSHVTYEWIELPFQRLGYSGVAQLLRRQEGKSPKPVTARDASRTPAANRRSLVPVGATALSAIVFVCAGLGAYAVASAPSKTSVQEQIEAMESPANSGLSSADVPVPPKPQPLPGGDQISVIGDSVALGSSEAFVRAFPGMTPNQIDAQVSRSYLQVPDILAQLSASGVERPAVIIAMGANGPAGAGYIDAILDEIGPDRLVVVMNSFSDLPVNADINSGVEDSVSRHPNAELGDWYSAIKDRTDLLAADDVHPAGVEGQDLYAETARSALQKLVDRRAAQGLPPAIPPTPSDG